MTGRRYTLVSAQLWSSEEEHRADALAPGAEEGRDKLRKAAGRSTYPPDPRVSEWGNPLERTSSMHT